MDWVIFLLIILIGINAIGFYGIEVMDKRKLESLGGIIEKIQEINKKIK